MSVADIISSPENNEQREHEHRKRHMLRSRFKMRRVTEAQNCLNCCTLITHENANKSMTKSQMY